MIGKQFKSVIKERPIGMFQQYLLPRKIFSFAMVLLSILCLITSLAWGQMNVMMDPEQMEVSMATIEDQDLGYVLSGLSQNSINTMPENQRLIDPQQADSLGIETGGQSSALMHMPIDPEQAIELIHE